jgi:hypothetical protein
MLQIPTNLANYVAVYCMPGYYPREELNNLNSPDNTPVAGEQVELLPTTANPAQIGIAVEAQVRRVADTLAYFENSNPDIFRTAVAQRASAINDFDLKGVIEALTTARSKTVAR